MYIYNFEKLRVWHDSKELALNIYRISTSFPDDEKFGLVSQIRRASVSICSNLAEGNSNSSLKHQARYSNIAYSSAMEVLNQLIIASELGYVKKSDYTFLRRKIEGITNKINSLRNYQLRQQTNKRINE